MSDQTAFGQLYLIGAVFTARGVFTDNSGVLGNHILQFRIACRFMGSNPVDISYKHGLNNLTEPSLN